MKPMLLIFTVFLLFSVNILAAQTNEWGTQYVTFDDAINGTLNRTSSVAVVAPNNFVALVTRNSAAQGNLINYLVGYVSADSANGRLSDPMPTGSGVGAWQFNLDQVDFSDAYQIAGGPDNLVYLANNDANHNILVFELTADAVASAGFRMETGTETIWAIDVDNNGYVYVCDVTGDDTKTDEVKVYPPVTDTNAAWETTHDSAPIATIDLPPGDYRGIAASGNGDQIFISGSSERSLWKFTGDPTNGYTQDTGFVYTLSAADTGSVGVGIPTLLGSSYMDDPGLIFVAADTLHTGAYNSTDDAYGRIYVVDPITATAVDTIDQAQWNFDHAGDYSTGSSDGLWSGFASTYDVDVEASEQAVYSQSWFGWAVEKWLFDGDLENITSVDQIVSNVPENYSLKQNYPNPFNPTTTIEFDVKATENVTLTVYNVLGQQVAVLVNERLAPGTYKTTLNAADLTSGVYYYALKAGSFKTVKKLVLTK